MPTVIQFCDEGLHIFVWAVYNVQADLLGTWVQLVRSFLSKRYVNFSFPFKKAPMQVSRQSSSVIHFVLLGSVYVFNFTSTIKD